MVKKWVYEKRIVGSHTDRLFQKCLIELVQNLTQSFSNIGTDTALTKVLYYTLKSTPKKVSLYHRNVLTIYILYTSYELRHMEIMMMMEMK